MFILQGFLPVIILIGVLIWLLTRSHGSTPGATIADLEATNRKLKSDLEALIAQAAAETASQHNAKKCKEITDALTGWDHSSTQEVKNWLVSQGFWRCEIEGMPAYTNGRFTWHATPASPEEERAIRTKAVYQLRSTGKRTSPAVWLYNDIVDATKQMVKEMENAARHS